MEEIRQNEYLFRRRLIHNTAPAPSSSNGTEAAHLNYDLRKNILITFSVFLIVLIIHIIMKLIVKYVWTMEEESFRIEMPNREFLRSSNRKKRRKKLEIQIPARVYESEVEIQGTECTVCLGEFMMGEEVRVLPMCRHGFHVKCIDKWMAKNTTCPTCRSIVV